MALYQHRQDRAVGINWMSGRVRGLLWYYRRLQQDNLSGLMTAAYLNGVIQQGAKEIKDLVELAQVSDNKQEILKQAQAIQRGVEMAKIALDKINLETYIRSNLRETG